MGNGKVKIVCLLFRRPMKWNEIKCDGCESYDKSNWGYIHK